MNVIDAHAHLEPRMLTVDKVIEKMDANGIDKVALIPNMNDPLPRSPEGLLSFMRYLMNSPFHDLARRFNALFYTDDGDLKLQGTIYRIYPYPDNQAVADAIEAHPDRFLGWIFLNPKVMENPVEELERWRRVPGFIGVKLHPHWHGWHILDALPIARRCEELELPVLIHLGFGDGGKWQLLSDRCPKLKIIFAHAGMPHFRRMWSAVRENKNLRVDLSSPYLDENLVRQAVAAIGPERSLYGTDAPYGFHEPDDSYDYGHIMKWVHRLPFGSTEIDRILGDNIEELVADRR